MTMTRTESTDQPQSYLRAPEGVPPIRVLVVDDEPDLADLVSTALRFDGCRTATAGDADEGLAWGGGDDRPADPTLARVRSSWWLMSLLLLLQWMLLPQLP